MCLPARGGTRVTPGEGPGVASPWDRTERVEWDMLNGDTLDRVKRAKAARTHVERKHGADHDEYGATVASGGKVNMPPVTVARYDGVVDTRRLNDLARMCGKGGFVVHPRSGNRALVRQGYAVSVWPGRDQLIGGFVKGRDILAFMIANWDLLWEGRALVQARRVHAGGGKYVTRLSVVRVVKRIERARNLARVNEQSSFVDMRDGKIETA